MPLEAEPSFRYGTIVPFRYGTVCRLRDHMSVTEPYFRCGTIGRSRVDHLSVMDPLSVMDRPSIRYGTIWQLLDSVSLCQLREHMSVAKASIRYRTIDPLCGTTVPLRDHRSVTGPIRDYEDHGLFKGSPFGYGTIDPARDYRSVTAIIC